MNEMLNTHIKHNYVIKLIRGDEDTYILQSPANKQLSMPEKQVVAKMRDGFVELSTGDTIVTIELTRELQASIIITYLALEQTVRKMDASLVGIFNKDNEYIGSAFYDEWGLTEEEQERAYIGTVILAAMDKTNKMTQYLEELLNA